MPASSSKDSADGKPIPEPLTFRETLAILFAGHIGVRKKEQRVQDFERASGLRIFVAALLYFLIIVAGLVFFVRLLTS